MVPRFPALAGAKTRFIRLLAGSDLRSGLLQALLAAAVMGAAWSLYNIAAQNLSELGIASGFGFLGREAGFAIGETTLLSYTAADTYLRALAVGVFNTVRVSALGIVIATLLGTLIGLARLSRNWLLSRLAAGYVELMRNVPLLVQLFFWYVLITDNLPGPRQALEPLPGVYLSNRGIALPVLHMQPAYAWMAGALGAGALAAWLLARWATRRQARTGKTFSTLAAGVALVLGPPVAVFLAAGAPLRVSMPVLRGFNFAAGATLTPEFAALLAGLSLYTAAFIGEIVRAGVLAVDRGQFEAADALGLRPRQAMRRVILPQALRLIVPPLTSQFLNLTKNSSLAVAIGYPDLVSIANTTMNQTGQAIEGIAIIMAVYLTISLSISALMNWYNRRTALRGARPA